MRFYAILIASRVLVESGKLVLARTGRSHVAAFSILMQYATVPNSIALGFWHAAAVLLCIAIGEGDRRLFFAYWRATLEVCLIIDCKLMIIASLALLKYLDIY